MPEKINKNCVYLVGAGPGDVGLITVRGRDLLGRADVIIYDNLASRELLNYAQADAEKIYVGKKVGSHSLPQDQINQLLIDKARNAPIVVRLKGGDPYVFGRGGEEAVALSDAGIRFEVVPGVTAGVAVPAYAGIPVTHRDFASDLAFITGHEDASRTETSQIDWPSLGKWRGTLAFYMGVKNLPFITEKLIAHGMAPETPSAIIHQGTTPAQKTVTANLTQLPQAAKDAKIKPPALIIVGNVVSLRDKLKWFENRPLFGKKIVVTRARAQASDLVEQLHQLGADVLEFPTIRIEPPTEMEPLYQAVEKLAQYDWLIFTSVNGVDSFFNALGQKGRDARALATVKVAAIGPATTGRLAEHGIKADLVPPQYIAESIVESLKTVDNLTGKKILLARADIARTDLRDQLQNLGAAVNDISVYRTVPDNTPSDEIVEALRTDEIDYITFTSSSTVTNFADQIDIRLLSGTKTKIASIGPVTSATAHTLGLKVDIEAEEFTIDKLIEAICTNEETP